jgi:hypothetical protein
MNIDIKNIIENIIKTIKIYLEDEKVIYEIINFDYYLKKTENYYIKKPDEYFKKIGKNLFSNIKNYIYDIYNIRFIQECDIIEETNISFSFEIIYLNLEKEIFVIKNIIHIIQYNEENCVFKIMPLCNITSKSIYVNIKKNIKDLNYITNKINQLNLKTQCSYYPRTGKNKGIRCKNESNNESSITNTPLCNKHKRFK